MNSEKQSTNLQMTLRGVNRVGEGQKNVPKLRFKGYEDAWEQRKVSEITKFHKQGYYTTEEYNDNKKYYLLRGTDLTGNKLVLKDTPKIDATEKDYDAFKTEIGDFLIVRSGNVGTYGIVDVDIPAIFGSYLIDFRFDTEKVTNEFFGYFYQSERFQSQLNKITQSSANINVNAENIKSTYISLPVLIEQKKISNIMIALDNCITLHQRKYDALKSMKKTLLSKIFPKNGEDVPEIRFKGYTDAWEQRKLGEIVLSEIKGSAKAEMIGGDTPYLETNYLNGGECLFVDSENNVDTDDVIVLWDGSQAGTVYHGFSGALGSTFKAYKTKCLGLFIFQQLKKNQQTIYDKYRTPNIPHVIKTFKDEYDVMLTSEEEQNEIGRYFQQIDHLITLHQRKLEELKKMKKTLLQQMFV